MDDIRIYEFIDSIEQLPRNNPIATFQTASEIIEHLRVQWAGLFQRFLQDQKRIEEIRVLDEMQSVASTLAQMVKFLTEEREDKDEAFEKILLTNNPVFYRFQEITDTPYRVFFTNEDELDKWLQSSGWDSVLEERYDEGSYREWVERTTHRYIRLTEEIFDQEGQLRVYTQDTWRNVWLEMLEYSP